MKIAFFWTWDFSKNILASILTNTSVEVALVVSQPDKHIGRKKILTPTPVKILAEEKNIPVLQPEKLRNNVEFFDSLKKLNLDFIVVVAYGKIVPNEVLEAPKYACINIHWSILPLYRWASPIQEAVKNWDPKTGFTIMYMSEWMDEWDILKIHEVEINRDDSTQDIFEKFQESAAEVLIHTLKSVISWEIVWVKQDESKATYCSKIDKEDGQIDFNNSAVSIYNQHKAYKIWPGIFTQYNNKKFSIESCDFIDCEILEEWVFEIWDILEYSHEWKNSVWIACSSWILILKEIKLEWKKTMDINSFINGNKDFLDYNFKIQKHV